jgi:hypothetical protein
MPTEAREPRNLDQGTRDVTKKVRLTDGEAGLLATLAEDEEVTESQILRRGLRIQDRMRRRAANIDRLTALAEDEEPETIRFPLED